MSFEMKQCPYCGSWCHPQLVIADEYNSGTSNVTTYKVVYPCVCKTMPYWDHLEPTSVTNVDEVSK